LILQAATAIGEPIGESSGEELSEDHCIQTLLRIAVSLALDFGQQIAQCRLRVLDNLGGDKSATSQEFGVALKLRQEAPHGLIDSAPKLRAFVLARIERMTLTALAEVSARQFPPVRRVGKSALDDWFHRNRPDSHPR
jgi:hypothetical protein